MTIFGAVNGFSRFPVFLKCVSNNKSETLLSCFMKGLQTCGVQSGCDRITGSENVLIRNFIFTNQGPECVSLICGKSTHNQRTERLWRDVYNFVTRIYHELTTYGG